MAILQSILSVIAIWFLVSIPASFLVGWFLATRNNYEENVQIKSAVAERRPYPELQQLDETLTF